MGIITENEHDRDALAKAAKPGHISVESGP
jgi:hypothetical protein